MKKVLKGLGVALFCTAPFPLGVWMVNCDDEALKVMLIAVIVPNMIVATGIMKNYLNKKP